MISFSVTAFFAVAILLGLWRVQKMSEFPKINGSKMVTLSMLKGGQTPTESIVTKIKTTRNTYSTQKLASAIITTIQTTTTIQQYKPQPHPQPQKK